MSTAISHSFQVGSQTVTLETNRIAKQAQASVWVSCKKTRVLVTLCLQSQGEGYKDFLPLTVHYQERAYAAGAIPGSFFRREGRPSESEVLSSRLIDRSVRPLAHELFFDDMQLLAQVMSYDPEGVSAEVLAMIGASAAVAISGAPFEGPFGVAHVGFDGKAPFLLSDCASAAQQESQLNLVAAGIQGKQHMIESEAQGVSEANMLDALAFAQTKIDEMTGHIEAFAALKGAKSTWLWEGAPLWDGAAYKAIDAAHGNKVAEVFNIQDKAQRYAAKDEWKQAVLNEYKDHETVSASSVLAILKDIERNHVRKQLLEGKPRIDGRDHKTVRPISIELGVLPQSHGSALFTRGETQAIVSVVMGSEKMAQMLDGLDGNKNNTFMLHYNFPSYCVGEVGMVSSPKRREIGHGNLARRALKSGIPDKESFPYVLRIVSEITESNGSSSMATVCGSSLAMMDAGVPFKVGVSGIAMGLIQEGDKHVVLSDILGDEDHLGDMDFKVAGTAEGITALQMDVKNKGISKNLMKTAVAQAREGQLHILNIMNKAIDVPRAELGEHVPRITTIKIHPDKIREVIGKGGATIKGITERHGVTIDISDDGTVKICAVGRQAAEDVKAEIKTITADVEIGQIYDRAEVIKVMDFGAFVSLLPGKDGFLHISQIKAERIEDLHEELEAGDILRVKVTEIDRQGRVKVSMRDLDTDHSG